MKIENVYSYEESQFCLRCILNNILIHTNIKVIHDRSSRSIKLNKVYSIIVNSNPQDFTTTESYPITRLMHLTYKLTLINIRNSNINNE